MDCIIYKYATPCGDIIIGSHGNKLCICKWAAVDTVEGQYGMSDIIADTICQLDEYFMHKREKFNLTIELSGTEFQCAVWNELTNVEYGETISYSELARRIGRPNAVRAVAHTVGANPISIIIPCHRIIGKDGSLTGYHGGIPAKKYLLKLEQKQ